MLERCPQSQPSPCCSCCPSPGPDLRGKDPGPCCTDARPSPTPRACGYLGQVWARRHMFSQVADEDLRLGGTRGLAQSLFVKLTASLGAGIGLGQQWGRNWRPKTLNTSRWGKGGSPRGEFGFFPADDASVETKRRRLGGNSPSPSLITTNSITTANSSLPSISRALPRPRDCVPHGQVYQGRRC